MPSIALGDTKIGYTETGAGQPVMLLHSSASSSRQWSELADELADRFHILAPDLYGYGETDPWQGMRHLRLADEAALAGLLASEKGQPVHVVGHSYGGAVALRLALDYPDLVQSLTLIEPMALHLLRDRSEADDAHYQEVIKVANAVQLAVFSGHYWRGMMHFVDYWNGAGTWVSMSRDRQADLSRQAGKVALEFWAISRDRARLDDFRALRVPTMILRGSDSLGPARRIADLLTITLPFVAYQTIEGAGHMLPVTHREAVNQMVARHVDWCARRPQQAA